MKFISNLMNTMKLNQEDDYGFSDDYEYDEEYDEEYEETEKPLFFGKKSKAEEADEPKEEESRIGLFGRPKVISNPNFRRAPMELTMIKPTSMNDSNEICKYLLSGKAVVLNMEGLQLELSQRIIDFTSGAVFSIEGQLQKISTYIFIATPHGVELSGEFQNILGGGSSDLSLSGLNLKI